MAPAASAARKLGCPTRSFKVMTRRHSPRRTIPCRRRQNSKLHVVTPGFATVASVIGAGEAARRLRGRRYSAHAAKYLWQTGRAPSGGPLTAHGKRHQGNEREYCDGHQGRQEGDRRSDGKAQELGPLGQGRSRRHAQPASRREDIVKAASLIRTGKVFALGIPLDASGPQNGLFGGRFNPIHQMLATGTDAIAGRRTGTASATPTTR